MLVRWCLALLCLILCLNAQPLPVEKVLEARRIADLHFSPDGQRLAFTVDEPLKGAQPVSHIWVLDMASGALRQFTSSTAGERSPRWSPDGKQLAFLSNRDSAPKLYLMPLDGGEAKAWLSTKHRIDSFAWSPNGTSIAFRAGELPTEAEEKKTTDKDDARVEDDAAKRPRLWVSTVTDPKPAAIGEPGWKIDDFQWLDDSRLIVTASPKPSRIEWNASLYLAPSTGGKWTSWAVPPRPFGNLTLSPDRSLLAIHATRKDGPDPHDLYLTPISRPEFKNVSETLFDRLAAQTAWVDSRTLYASFVEGFQTALYKIALPSDRERIELPVNAGAIAVSPNGTLAVVGGSSTELPELWLREPGKLARKVSSFHSSWKDTALVKPAIFAYRSFDGRQIEAALYTPRDAKPQTGYPLAVLIHGGPTGAWSNNFEPWSQLLVSRGYAVFSPNIRGSIGYGHAFIAANRGDWGGGDFKDIMAGVDDLIQRGVADGNRLGIAGWSYGGYMASWAITQTNRFKAAVSGAGMADLATEFGTEEEASYDRWFYGLPYENLAGFQHSSPIGFIKNAKTPTLILQGEADTTDPLSQSQMLYRGLRAYGVETELVVYPREGHGLREEKHRVDSLNRIIGWFDRYVR